jgi:hypothetical protein
MTETKQSPRELVVAGAFRFHTVCVEIIGDGGGHVDVVETDEDTHSAQGESLQVLFPTQ